MPPSDYFKQRLTELEAWYADKFPGSLYPGKFAYSSHATPSGRIKKLCMTFPANYDRTYSGVPAVSVIAHRDVKPTKAGKAQQAHPGKIRVHVVNLITEACHERSLTVSEKTPSRNRAAMDTIVQMLGKELAALGRMTQHPDHYAE
jgi:hypothetical protein